MKKVHKFPIDLDAQDYAVLTRMRDHLGVPGATIFRWALRYYALIGPWCLGSDKRRREMLEGSFSLNVGPGIWESLVCEVEETPPPPPQPQRHRRPKSKG